MSDRDEDLKREKEADIEHVRRAVATLKEHFENVQVFVSRILDDGDDAGNTVSIQRGSGNWHARESQVREWVIENEERVRENIRKEERE